MCVCFNAFSDWWCGVHARAGAHAHQFYRCSTINNRRTHRTHSEKNEEEKNNATTHTRERAYARARVIVDNNSSRTWMRVRGSTVRIFGARRTAPAPPFTIRIKEKAKHIRILQSTTNTHTHTQKTQQICVIKRGAAVSAWIGVCSYVYVA